MAETPEEVLLRLERGRSNDALEEKRRQETLEWQRRRKEQEYSARWKRYGDFEVDVKQWRRLETSVWITEARYDLLIGASGESSSANNDSDSKDKTSSPVTLDREVYRLIYPNTFDTPKRKRFSDSLDALVSQSVMTIKERCVATRNGSICTAVEKRGWISVSCGSLHISKRVADNEWGKWERPLPGSNEERLVVERCASGTEQNRGREDKDL